MIRNILLFTLTGVACWLLPDRQALAHPHVWVTMTAEVVYATDGTVTGVRHGWTFDDMYSAFATQGLAGKTKGEFTREELMPLAKINIESLKEYEFFTFAKADGKTQRTAFKEPVDYWLDFDPNEKVLTLRFTLPLRRPVKAKALDIDVYDPEFFVDFTFAEKNPVTLVGAPAQCKVAAGKPNDGSFPSSLRLDKSFMESNANAGMGASFANKISVTCP
jgi:ABC-type uncharacterized transport system substrate-binding protein